MYQSVKNYPSRIEAEVDTHMLESQGISSVVLSDDAGGMRPDVGMSTGGVWLSVDEKDVDTARAILNV